MNLAFTNQAKKDLAEIIAEDAKLGGKIFDLILDISKNGHQGKGHPEALKGNYSGWWSRRIDKKHRLIYQIEEGFIIIARCYGHYDD